MEAVEARAKKDFISDDQPEPTKDKNRKDRKLVATVEARASRGWNSVKTKLKKRKTELKDRKQKEVAEEAALKKDEIRIRYQTAKVQLRAEKMQFNSEKLKFKNQHPK